MSVIFQDKNIEDWRLKGKDTKVAINNGSSSIPLFETHKSIEKNTNIGNKLKLRETHQI